MNQKYFEMKDVERKSYNKAVWIPIIACYAIEQNGEYGREGFSEEFFICHSLAIPLTNKDRANNLKWIDRGHFGYGMPWVNEKGNYIPSEIYLDDNEQILGNHLVIEQLYDGLAIKEYHLNQDFVIALGLKREGDIWVCPNDGYIEVARIIRNEDSSPYILEVRAEYLKDYLCARRMALYLMTFQSRKIIVKNRLGFSWNENMSSRNSDNVRWEGYIHEIHEGGFPFGEETAVFHVARTDIDETEDVPIMGVPTDENTELTTWISGLEGQKLYSINGEMWKHEWIDPAEYSPRVASDTVPSSVYFITDAQGTKESKDTLKKDGRWLWFRPTIISDILGHRGSGLNWYTAETGEVGCLKNNFVHFGINRLGLVNVYAKDIAMLPDWQQQIWAGHNTSPEGKVSAELLKSQVEARPAQTKAPEMYLSIVLKSIVKISNEKLGFSIIKKHDSIPDILTKCNRFRAVDNAGLYALAKDLARITADSIDAKAIQTIIKPPKGQRWGSLKSLENLLSKITSNKNAREIMGPLVGIYELRLSDAHLPGSGIDETLELIGIDKTTSYIHQGYSLIHSCVSCLYKISEVISKFNKQSVQ